METSSSDFHLWNVFLGSEEWANRFNPILDATAELQAEIRRSWVKNPRGIKGDKFRVSYRMTARRKSQEAMSIEARTAMSKAAWFVATGYRPKKGK